MAIEFETSAPPPTRLTWTIDRERGTVRFGRTPPFAGNTYSLTLAGGESGDLFVAYVMDDSGLNCLAKSVGADAANLSIALTSKALRDEFLREPHEARAFHVFIRSATAAADGPIEGDTVAEGDLTIIWNPLWTDKEVGRAYTMQGREGKPGAPGKPGAQGDRGLSAYEVAVANGFGGSELEWLASLRGISVAGLVRCEDNGLYYAIRCVDSDENGGIVLTLDQDPSEPNALSVDDLVTLSTTQIISGGKTFTVPIVGDITGNANTATSATSATNDGEGNPIASTYLPKSGGEMAGAIAWNIADLHLTNKAEGGAITIKIGEAADKGASLKLSGGDSEDSGAFKLVAASGEASCTLTGTADGDLLWDGSTVGLPTGTVLPYAANTPPKGFLLCDGAAVSRETYARLFNVIGTTYGEGDGETTFELPDLVNRFVEGSTTAGTVLEAGLPDHHHSIGGFSCHGDNGEAGRVAWSDGDTSSDNYTWHEAYTDKASKLNAIYGKSETVQPPAVTMLYIIKD